MLSCLSKKITGFNELTGPDTHAIADGADDFAVACKFEELPILAATHPGIAFVVKVQCADEISYRQGLVEYPIGRIIFAAGTGDRNLLERRIRPIVRSLGAAGSI